MVAEGARVARANAVLAWAAALLAIAACGSDDGTSSPTTTVTVSQSAPASSDTPASSEDPPAQPEQSRIESTAADANVDPADFANGGGFGQGYYFQSPSGNVRCGLGFQDATIGAGCQALTSVRSSTGVTCTNAGNSLYSSAFVDGAARSVCSNQPFYVGNTVPGQPVGTYGGRVLAYGQTISVGMVTCTSRTEGITCSSLGVGFTMSRDRNEFF